MKQLDAFERAKGMQGGLQAVADRYGPNLDDLKQRVEQMSNVATPAQNRRAHIN